MSLATRCPSCGTTFKVVRDQLRISDGWVRCGRCSEVFDATAALHEDDGAGGWVAQTPPPLPAIDEQALPPAASMAPEPAVPPVQAPPPPAAGPALPAIDWPARDLLDLPRAPAPEPATPATPPAPALPPLPSLNLVADAPGPSAVAAPPPEAPAKEPPAPVVVPALAPAPEAAPSLSVPSQVDEAVDAQLQKALRRAKVQALRAARASRREAGAPAAPQDDEPPMPSVASEAPAAVEAPAASPVLPSFLRRGGGATGRLSGRAWVLASVAAALLLVAQMLRQERDLLAARAPALRPLLAGLCSLSGCTVSALRQIEAIKIDSTAFTPEPGERRYRLDITLRSTAPIALAMPSIELVLLDREERLLLRRVLSPADFRVPEVLDPHAERMASLPLALDAEQAASLPPVAGYRVVAFYP